MFWTLLVAFLKDTFTGELFQIWHEHKLTEARNAAHDVDTMSPDDIDRRMREITRK
jgi:hypothetical protein